MHTHGTAVLDRPAEAMAPAVTSLSALVPSEPAHDLESAKSISNAAELTTRYDAVFDLGYAELAVALYASGIRPALFRSAPAAQLIEWAAQGLALLGIKRVRVYARRTSHINLILADTGYNTAHEQAEYNRMWPCSPRTVRSCHDAAYRITYTLHPSVSQITLASPAHPCPSHTAPRAPLAVPLSWSGL
jgi:hypothetical protein